MIRTRQVKQVVKSGTEGLEERLDAGLTTLEARVDKGLGDIQAQATASASELTARMDEKMAAIEIPTLPDGLGQDVKDILALVPDEDEIKERQEDLLAGVITYLDAKLASEKGVRQKELYDWMNQNEKAFAGLDQETQGLAVAQLDLTSQALTEIAQIKMSPKAAKESPFMAMAVNMGRTGAAQMLMKMRQEGLGVMQGQQAGNVTIHNRGGPGIPHQ